MARASRRPTGLTVAEAAKQLGKPEHFIRNRIARRTLKAKKTKSGWRIPRKELENLKAARVRLAKELLAEFQ